MIDELYGCTCGCCNGGVSDSAVSVGVEISDDLLDEILQEIYNEEVDELSGISPTLFFAVRDYFHKAIDDGLINSANADIDNETAFIDALKHSADVFSLHRTANQCALLVESMVDSDGNLKSFEQFKKDTQSINNHYNKAWLRTEYDTAVLRAQMGADWKMFQRDADVLPNLRWMPTTSVSPRDEHKVFWSQGLTLPIDDKFWNKHRPGDQWNCKCWLEQTDAEPTAPEDMPDSADMPEPKAGLRGNPAKTKEIFSQDHPHFPNKCATCHLNTDGKVHGVKGDNTAKDASRSEIIGNCFNCVMSKKCDQRITKQIEDLESQKKSTEELMKDLVDYTGAELKKRLEACINGIVYVDHEDCPKIHIAKSAFSEHDINNLKMGALKAVEFGNEVWILPNPRKIPSADFIFKKDSNLLLYDMKVITGKSSVAEDLIDSSRQTRRALLILDTNYDKRQLAKDINSYFKNNEKAQEVLIYKKKVSLSIYRNTWVRSKKFISDFLKLFNKK